MGEKPFYGKKQIIITADESCMHNYNMSFMAGFLSCAPRDLMPKSVQSFIEKKFFSNVPNKQGVAEISILALRRVESYLHELNITDVAIATPQSAPYFKADVFFVSTMDPFGIGPATTTMLGLSGGKEPFNKYFFERLVKRIRENNPNAKILVGGPGAWEFNIMREKQNELKIDCVFEGAVEGTEKNFFDNAIQGNVPKYFKPKSVRPKPSMIKGPAFWGMVEISRGCGRGCQFCDFELMSGFDWLPKDFIMKEAKINAESVLTNHICLLSEDTLRYGTPKGQWKPSGDVVDLVKDISKLGKQVSFSHCCLATALANPKVIEDVAYYCNLSEKNLGGFQTGIESGSPAIMKKYMQGKLLPWKPEDWPEVVQQGFAVMIDNYVIPHATLVVGLEGEKPEDSLKTIELIDDLRDYPSIIMPMFFVPLSILKERFFLVDLMTQEQKELLMAATKHSAKWSRKLPNWSGRLPFFDKIAFVTGAEYSFGYLELISRGQGNDNVKITKTLMTSFFKSLYQLTKNSEPDLEYYENNKKQYPVLEKIKHLQPDAPANVDVTVEELLNPKA